MNLTDRYFDEILLCFLIIVFLGTWIVFRTDKVFELVFGTLTALLGILRGKYRAGNETR